MDISGLARVRADIDESASMAGVPSSLITLVVVSKGRSHDDVEAIASTGHTVFGENRQQGLAERIERGFPSRIEWHFVGPLQRRKVRWVEEHVTLLHSMDRLSLARSWVAAGDKPALVQFNLGNEPQKSGFDPDSAGAVVETLLAIGVDVRGVMAIPPQAQDPEETRPYFAALRKIYERYRDEYDNMEHCSMGMSSDFQIAIEEGSTMVRVGRAIFEPRDR